jgi:predicted MFS family arabinose efflux permease
MFFTAALVLMTVGKYVFDPAMQAYLGDRIPYARRGAALAVSELGWALSFILGVPAVGFLIAEFGWRSPFLVLSLLGFLTFITIRLFFPGDRVRIAQSPEENSGETGPPDLTHENHFASFKRVLSSGAALFGLTAVLFISASNEVINVTFGVWLEDSFGLRIAALGAASAVIGFSDLSSELLVAATVDRLGKIRAIILGLSGNAAAALLLPVAGSSTFGALAGLFAYYLTFEYTIVSLIPLMSEVLPEARATLLALNTAAFSLGRAFTAWLALRLYEVSFFSAILAAAAFNILALAALLRLRRLSEGKV